MSLPQLSAELSRFGVSVAAVSEVSKHWSGQISRKGYPYYRNNMTEGCGAVIHRLVDLVEKVAHVNKRIVNMKIVCNLRVNTLVSASAPTGVSDSP